MDINLTDDELFDGLFGDSEPRGDYDVAALLRTIGKLEYKLAKQKEYKTYVEGLLAAGVLKTEEAISSLRKYILNYMIQNNKTKLTFDDLGTVSLTGKDKKDYVFKDEEALLQFLQSDAGYEFCLNKKTTINKTELKSYLKNNPTEVEKLPGVDLEAKDPTISIRLK